MRSNGIILISCAIFAIIATVNAQTNLSLSDAIRMAEEHSFKVKASRSDSISASSDLKASRALRYPTLSLSATSFRIDKLQSITLPFVGSRTLGVKDNYQADFRLSMPLFAGGRILNQVRIQAAQSDLKSISLQADRLTNVYSVRKAYLGLLASMATVSGAKSSLSRVKIVRQDVDNLFKAGLADSVDILQADIALEKASQNLNDKETTQLNASLSLARLIGMPDENMIIPEYSVPDPDYENYRDRMPSPSDIARPEMKIVESRVRAARLAVDLSSANLFPLISGFGGYSYGKPNRDLFNHTWNDYWTAGLNLTWDFNLGGRTISSIRSASELAKSATMNKNDFEETILFAARTSWQNLGLAYNSYVSLGKQFELAQREFRLAQIRQKAGRLSSNRLLEAEADLTSAEEMYRISLINYFNSKNEYLYAIGSPAMYGGY